VLVEDMTNMNLMHLGTTMELQPVAIQHTQAVEIANTAQRRAPATSSSPKR
jgi:hypothetical protein